MPNQLAIELSQPPRGQQRHCAWAEHRRRHVRKARRPGTAAGDVLGKLQHDLQCAAQCDHGPLGKPMLKFPPRKGNYMEIITANFAGVLRHEMIDGKQFIVVRSSLIVPGVLDGSKGPLLYPETEIRRSVKAWEGVPLTLGHPIRNGIQVAATDSAAVKIGFVKRASMNGKLTAETWFDVTELQRVAPGLLANLEAGKQIELSTGLFTDNEEAPNGSTYLGKRYKFVARNYQPDHLAILPNQVGACSIADGCGVLVNSNSEDETMENDLLIPPETFPTTNAVSPYRESECDVDYLPLPVMNFKEVARPRLTEQQETEIDSDDDCLPLPTMTW